MTAGAPAVIASLWPVNDQASAMLMMRFYDFMAEGLTSADALRQAQQSLLGEEPTADPYYWAAFGLYGFGGGRLQVDEQ